MTQTATSKISASGGSPSAIRQLLQVENIGIAFGGLKAVQ
ncbi:MAG: hypothetical protein JWM11_7661, partial [Planctomycetaceae bacterium]|nr:hypothetical protein [Planctomycetaceae bacterium]